MFICTCTMPLVYSQKSKPIQHAFFAEKMRSWVFGVKKDPAIVRLAKYDKNCTLELLAEV